MRPDSPSRSVAPRDRGRPDPLDRLLRPPVLTLFAAIMALGSAMIGLHFLLSADEIVEARGKVATGDFISFYTAASIVRDGEGDKLYDLGAQLERQTRLTGRTREERWSGFINPPLLAVALAPLARLPYTTAFRLYSLLMILLFAGTVVLLHGVLPGLRRSTPAYWTAWLLVFSFHPVFRTMIGGQTTVLTLFLLAGVYSAWRRERWLLTGLFLGLLSYKPQFVPLLGLVLLAERRWPAVAAAALAGSGHYALGGLFCGWAWPLRLMAALRDYRPLEETTFHSHIALIPALQFAVPEPLDRWLIAFSVLAVLAGVVWAYRRYASAAEWTAAAAGRTPGAGFGLLFALLVTAAMLTSPHLQYYDVGLLSLPVLLVVERTRQVGDTLPLGARLAIGAGYLLYPLHELGDTIHFQPLLLWPLACFLWAGWLLSRSRAAPATL